MKDLSTVVVAAAAMLAASQTNASVLIQYSGNTWDYGQPTPAIDLTALGTLDWQKIGVAGTSAVEHKSGANLLTFAATSQTTPTPTAFATPTGSFAKFQWSDGTTVTSSASDTTKYQPAENVGFDTLTWTAPSDLAGTQRRLSVFIRNFNGTTAGMQYIKADLGAETYTLNIPFSAVTFPGWDATHRVAQFDILFSTTSGATLNVNVVSKNGNDVQTGAAYLATVPEPASIGAVSLAMSGLAFRRRRSV